MTTNYSRPRPGTHCHHSLCPSCTKEDAPDPELVVSPWYWTCCYCRFRNLALTFHQREVSGTICCSPTPPPPEPAAIMSPILRAVASLNMISATWEDMECPIVTRQARIRARRQTYPLSTSSRSSDSSERIVRIPLIRVQPPGTYALQGQSMEQVLPDQTIVLTGQPSVSVPRRSVLTSRRSQPQRGGTSSNGCSHSCQFCLPSVEANLEWYFCCSCLHLHPHPLMQGRSSAKEG
jgi:hypothetical protein